MPQMTLHLINARNQLDEIETVLTESLRCAFAAASPLLPLLDTDVIVRAGKGVIPEKGHLRYAPEKGIIYVTVDPENPSLRTNANHSLEKMLAHELHHSARWDGPGYGQTLGEALVSEGLAGHFAQEVFGGHPEPWESLPGSTFRPYCSRAWNEWEDPNYRHDEWFFGTGELPQWLGYSFAYHIVGQYLAAHRDMQASALVYADADLFQRFLGDA